MERSSMDVKEAALIARSYITDIFSDDKITNVGLEEVKFDIDTNTWKITLGFSRPWDHVNNTLVAKLGGSIHPDRSYKVVHINDDNGTVISLTDRLLDTSK